MLHNSETGAWIELEYSSWFVFSSGQGIASMEVDCAMKITPATLSSTSSTLLTKLQAGGGTVPIPGSISEEWKILSNGPLVVLKSKIVQMQITLTRHGFIYSCSSGSLCIDWQQESNPNDFDAKKLIALEISDIRSVEYKARVESLRVRIV